MDMDVSLRLAAVRISTVAKAYGHELKPHGVSKCVFHQDRTPSMSISPAGRYGADLFNCFACGASGDAVGFVARLTGVDRRTAFKAVLNGFSPAPLRPLNSAKMKFDLPVPPSSFGDVILDDGQDVDFEVLSELRGISISGLRLAGERGYLKFGRYSGERAWAVVDAAALSLQFRPLRKGTWFGDRKAMCPKGVSTRVPLGLGIVPDAQFVHVLEGGPDFLAAHDVILAIDAGRLSRSAAVGFLGASIEPSRDACELFEGKDVVIWAHADEAGLRSALRKLELLSPFAKSISVLPASDLVPTANDLNDVLRSPGGIDSILSRQEVFHV